DAGVGAAGHATVGFELAEIGLSAGNYAAYEFWTETFLGVNDVCFQLEIPARAVRLLTVAKIDGAPQFLSSDRHVAQGAVDLLDSRWDAEAGVLTQKLRVVAGYATTCRYYVPEGMRFVAAKTTSGARLEATQTGEILRVSALAEESGDVEFTLKFAN
ncbi:MAG: hypothetical protein HUK22_05905, partial [Thermoguttaceae bacterium]|nr:hypothetical protein [Thermoguttaceae bacterium]